MNIDMSNLRTRLINDIQREASEYNKGVEGMILGVNLVFQTLAKIEEELKRQEAASEKEAKQEEAPIEGAASC